MPPQIAVDTLASVYSEADYVHPFREGNSRTLRLFTEYAARQAGLQVNWENIERLPNGRDILYMARDKAVVEKALQNERSSIWIQGLGASRDDLQGMKELSELMRDISRSYPPYALEHLPRSVAIQKHPELQATYEAMDQLARTSAARYGENSAQVSKAVEGAKQQTVRRMIDKDMQARAATPQRDRPRGR